MNKYEIQPGFSVTTKLGMAHSGAVIDASYLSMAPEDAADYLEGLVKNGKAVIVKPKQKQEEKKEEVKVQRKELIEKIDGLRKSLKEAKSGEEREKIKSDIETIEKSLRN